MNISTSPKSQHLHCFWDLAVLLPVVLQHHDFPEYHTSRDSIETVIPERLDETHHIMEEIIDIMEMGNYLVVLEIYVSMTVNLKTI